MAVKLERLIIKNFRSIGSTPVEVELDDIVILVGGNNTGKSTILKAYHAAVNHESLTIDDFHNRKIDKDNLPTIEIHTLCSGEDKPSDKFYVKAKDETPETFYLIKEQFIWEAAGAKNKSLDDYKGSASITQGLATTVKTNLFECENGRSRVAGIGEIADADGKVWTVPAQNHFTTAPKAADLYEECANITPNSIADVDEDSVPVAVIDSDGEEITGYIFADNYFELYINGQLIAVDTVPFTPFNSSIVKFKVSKPYTIAVKVIDWEENLGLGTEDNRGKAFHPGDGCLLYTNPQAYSLGIFFELFNVCAL